MTMMNRRLVAAGLLLAAVPAHAQPAPRPAQAPAPADPVAALRAFYAKPGPRLGMLVRRHGGLAVHLLPAGRRH